MNYEGYRTNVVSREQLDCKGRFCVAIARRWGGSGWDRRVASGRAIWAIQCGLGAGEKVTGAFDRIKALQDCDGVMEGRCRCCCCCGFVDPVRVRVAPFKV